MKNKKTKKNKNISEEIITEQVSDMMEAAEANEESEMTEAPTEVTVETSLFLQEETEIEGFLPEVEPTEETFKAEQINLEGSELEQFETAEIDELQFIEDERAESIVESILFASDRPVSLTSIVEVFKGTNIKKTHVKKIIDNLSVEYAGGRRGVSLEEVTGGYQLRTKIDNMNFLKTTVKAKPFKLSGPALETLAILAYKQPVIKSEIDQIRGVESGHLLRALMEKGLCHFEGKAENLPGRPMQYGTTRRFLEIFGLRSIKELPTLSQIDELLPEGITEEEAKPTLSMVTDSMSENVNSVSYSQGEEDLNKIENDLLNITTSSQFFEDEKLRQKQKKDADKAQDIRDALIVGEPVSTRDKNWLAKYEESLNPQTETTTNMPQELVEEKTEEELLAAAENELESEDETSLEDEIPFYDQADEIDENV